MTEAEAVRLIQIHERARQGESEGREGGVYDGEVFFLLKSTESMSQVPTEIIQKVSLI